VKTILHISVKGDPDQSFTFLVQPMLYQEEENENE